MSKGLEALANLFGAVEEEYSGCCVMKEFDKNKSAIEKELKEHECLKKLLKKIFAKDSDLCLEEWGHLDRHFSYHIVVNQGEDLDIEISKEEYDLLVRYRNGEENISDY